MENSNSRVNIRQSKLILGPKPTRLLCPSCNEIIMTRLEHEPSLKTHLMAVLLFCVTFCCCCIPYLIDSCQNANHYCPKCGAYLGTFQ